jgi:aminomethyltransferase
MVDFAGYSMPVEYKKAGGSHTLSIIESTKWTRESASLFDVSHMCSIRWTGKNAIDFVEHVTTADVRGMAPMMGGLSVIPNERGGVIDDTMLAKCVSKEHGEHVYQVVNAGCAPKDLKHFEEQMGKFGGDVKMEVLWDDRGLFALQGPKAAEVLQRLSPSVDLSKIGFGGMTWADILGANCLVWRCGYTGEDGFEIFVPGASATALWDKLKGEPEVRLAALGARDALRLEAGLCLYGHDLDEDITPPEASLAWVVAKARRDPSAKPFVGSDVILGQLKDKSYKRLRAGLMPSSGPPAREGATIETPDGENVGIVTSGTMSPCLKKNVTMGYINKPHNKTGTDLQVVVRGKKYPAKVVKMPFVPTKYYKA